MPAIRSYRDLKVWQKSVDLAVACYELSRRFPTSETYGLTAQLRRSAVSVAANIAEGHGREHLGDYLRHLSVATGSLMELETHLLIAGRLSYVEEKRLGEMFDRSGEISRMLSGLTTRLRARSGVSHLTPNT